MRFCISPIFAFAASAFAYQVLTPNGSNGWTNSGLQPTTWERVDTDPLNFTAVLTQQVLAAQVDGSLHNASLSPPSGGWPTGKAFRLNFCQDPQHLDSILAQSPEFDITAANTTSTKGSTQPTSFPPSVPTTNPSPTDDAGAAPPSNAALPLAGAQTGLIGFLALLGIILA